MFPVCPHCRGRHEPAAVCDSAHGPVNTGPTGKVDLQAEVDLLEDERIRQYVLRRRPRQRPAA
jgi:hypothetical protein